MKALQLLAYVVEMRTCAIEEVHDSVETAAAAARSWSWHDARDQDEEWNSALYFYKHFLPRILLKSDWIIMPVKFSDHCIQKRANDKYT